MSKNIMFAGFLIYIFSVCQGYCVRSNGRWMYKMQLSGTTEMMMELLKIGDNISLESKNMLIQGYIIQERTLFELKLESERNMSDFKLEYERVIYDLKLESERTISEKEKVYERMITNYSLALAAADSNATTCLQNLEKVISDLRIKLGAFSPRAFIEYVEGFKMPQTSKGKSRTDRWEDYFKSDADGRFLLQCIREKNKLWNTSEKDLAMRISGIYQSNSDLYHATSHEIHNGAEIVISRGNIQIQCLNLMICIATAFDISLKLE